MMGAGAEIAVGALCAVGAVFNAADSLRHSSEYFGEFAEQGWFAQARLIAARIILPNRVLAAVILMAFQTAVGAAFFTLAEMGQLRTTGSTPRAPGPGIRVPGDRAAPCRGCPI